MTTKNLRIYGRIFYGIAIAGVGILHFFYPGFRGMLTLVQTENILVIYPFAIYFIVSGLMITFDKRPRLVSTILAYVLLLFIIVGHLPTQFGRIKDTELGAWTNTLKMSAFVGGALLIAFANQSETIRNNFIARLSNLGRYGKYFFCIMLFVFGIDHFYYVDFVSGLVPKWIPFPVFWSWFTGICLLGAAITIPLNVKVKLVSQLLAIMLFIWLVTIHLVLAINYPEWNNGENLTACCQCLAFTGISLTIGSLADEIKD